MTAQEARYIAQTADNNRASQQLKMINADIETAARKGLYSITKYIPISSLVKSDLKNKGFGVTTEYEQTSGDTLVTISW